MSQQQALPANDRARTMRFKPLNLARWLIWGTTALVMLVLPLIWPQGFAITLLSQMGIMIIFALSYNMLLGQAGNLPIAAPAAHGPITSDGWSAAANRAVIPAVAAVLLRLRRNSRIACRRLRLASNVFGSCFQVARTLPAVHLLVRRPGTPLIATWGHLCRTPAVITNSLLPGSRSWRLQPAATSRHKGRAAACRRRRSVS